MHEWALAEAVIASVSDIVEREGFEEVEEVRIKVGELQQVEHDILKFALSQLRPARLEGTEFTIEVARAELRCRVCGNEWQFRKEDLDEHAAEAVHFVPEIIHAYVRCPWCGSPDFEVSKGRGLWIESIRGVRRGP